MSRDRARSDRHCAECDRDLSIGRAPKDEDVIVRCRRCGLDNVVRFGVYTREATSDERREALRERSEIRIGV